MLLAASLNLRLIFFFFFSGSVSRVLYLKKKRHSFAFVKRMVGGSLSLPFCASSVFQGPVSPHILPGEVPGPARGRAASPRILPWLPGASMRWQLAWTGVSTLPPSLRRCVRDPLRVAADSASLRHLGWEKHPPSPCPQE